MKVGDTVFSEKWRIGPTKIKEIGTCVAYTDTGRCGQPILVLDSPTFWGIEYHQHNFTVVEESSDSPIA